MVKSVIVPSDSDSGTGDSSASGIAVKQKWTLDGFVDYPLTADQQAHANVKLFR